MWLFWIIKEPYFEHPEIFNFFTTGKIDENLLAKIYSDENFLKKLELSHKFSLEFVKFMHSKKIYFDKNKILPYLKLYEFLKATNDKKNLDLLQVFILGYFK